ncbi:MAG: SDR family oxidoreductase [Clostridium sp.]|nr:SDR family oxidoreductase [Clostridium sp.]
MDCYLITGASSDVAIELLNRLEDRGEKCTALCQYNSNCLMLDKLKDTFKNVDIIKFQCNFEDENKTEQWVNDIKEKGYVVTHIVHAAASKLKYSRITKFDYCVLHSDIAVQVVSLGLILKTFLPMMKKAKFGKIVVVLSACTLGTPPKFMYNYIAAKYALEGLMKAVASDYAGNGININAVSPNMMETKFLDNVDGRWVQMNAENSAMKRNIKVSETVDSIMFLLSDASNYMNGVNLNLTGGDIM